MKRYSLTGKKITIAYTVFAAVLSFIVLSSFSLSSTACFRKQGVKGHVLRIRGNQMPSPDLPVSQGIAFKTTLYVYELTNRSQVTERNGFYTMVSTKLVKQLETNEDGSFKLKLKPGKYSLFIKKGDLFYANLFDSDNNIFPVEVKKGEWTEVDFKADYDAVY
ncbi:hypothetical protein WG954_08560 [Lacibacter sp. H375]|uniref:hypothetical protein n=1 Tax=Lacibacter sp. H375 TaxID=3133424 RepID=UPI0030BDADE1